jgi:hypothetical protein
MTSFHHAAGLARAPEALELRVMRLRSWMRPAAAETAISKTFLAVDDGDGYVAHGMGSFRHGP